MSETSTDRVRVLLIDDNTDLIDNIKEILEEEHDIAVATAPGGSEGLQLLKSERFDMVVTDMRMPGINGVEVLRYIKEHWPALPVVIMTAYAKDELLEQARREGVLAVLAKPVDFTHLSGFVQRVASGQTAVLVVEDDPALRTNLVEVLQEIDGVVPYAAPNVERALRLCEEIAPRAAIIDIRLPDGDGVQLGVELQNKYGPDGFEVIYTTGYVDELSEVVQSLLASPEVTFLVKPFPVETLVEAVRAMV